MNEACVNLLGADIGSPEVRLATRVLDHMRYQLAGSNERPGSMYNLEPPQPKAPGIACPSGCKLVRDEAGRDGRSIYTNSTQLPVNYTENVFHALDLQDGLQRRYTGGTVFHVFLGEASPDPGR